MNISLIGMPGCGKSALGRGLALVLKRPFYDCDKRVERQSGMSVAQIFEKGAEGAFRELEVLCIRECAGFENAVIATGGGAVLDGRNMEALKENGVIVFINRPIEYILKDIETQNRPLLKGGKERLRLLYDQRLPLYKKYADIEILNDSTKDDALKRIRQAVLRVR